MDLGRSLNPAIDRGQVLGGFVQGMGWSTTEELLYSNDGELLSHSPNNYKIPNVECMPADVRIEFLESPEDPINLLGSKAVGEPPFVLGLSVWAAAKQALGTLAPSRRSPALNLPATSEEILRVAGGGWRVASQLVHSHTTRHSPPAAREGGSGVKHRDQDTEVSGRGATPLDELASAGGGSASRWGGSPATC